jgi:very-short-patch-repair endonuclease
MEQTEVSFDEQMYASAVHFLLSEKENEAALALLSCTVDLEVYDSNWNSYGYALYLRGPRYVYESLKNEEHPISKSIKDAFDAVLPPKEYISKIIALANLVDVEPSWKAQMLEIAQGKEVHNQGIDINNRVTIIWKNLRFRSESEKRIAEALERANVLFMPNCLARLSRLEGRKNKEPDFVICDNGKWGILEVDGEPFHPPSRTTEDHKRDRDFLAHGIRVVQHYDASECYQQPDKVVGNFLNLLRT